MHKYLKYILPIAIPLLILYLPLSVFPFEGMTIVQKRIAAIFVFATLSWVLEPIPIYATSVAIIALELFLVSDKAIIFFRGLEGTPQYGVVINHVDIMATFASPIIMLFLGGFFLAIAATKFRLDVNLARVLLHPFGNNPRYVMLGLMLITGMFSMFMSNTATTAMMLSILAPVIALFSPKDPGRIAFALCIPLAANIGGIGTPIGTPPNAIALKYLQGINSINFGEWMAFGVPFALLMMAFSWFLINKLFPAKQQKITLDIQGEFLKTPKALLVYTIFIVTILLWLMGSVHGMNSYTVAMLPVTVFLMTGIITKDDLKKISWDVLWLVSGGIALGLALDKSGLAELIVYSIPFNSFSPYVVLVGATLMSWLMSNTATANLLLPMMAALGASMTSLAPLGGEVALILVVTFASSLGMALPISTPPNALAHATGHIKTNDMAKVGIIVGLSGVLLSFVVVWVLNLLGRV
ncbi:SLC13 family permease [Psychromonas sp. SP041]|uniref:SLC13 family permease n=1 Tax=Psychromonas sp. SP041 TaxID=1365007 RepID=UPI0010C7842F|nr:SLC13 family permease [Psychromonas sp. SP041]